MLMVWPFYTSARGFYLLWNNIHTVRWLHFDSSFFHIFFSALHFLFSTPTLPPIFSNRFLMLQNSDRFVIFLSVYPFLQVATKALCWCSVCREMQLNSGSGVFLTHSCVPPKVQDEKLENTSENYKRTKIFEANSLDLEDDLNSITLYSLHKMCKLFICILYLLLLPLFQAHPVFVVVIFVFDAYKLKRYFFQQGFLKTFTRPAWRKSRMFPGNSICSPCIFSLWCWSVLSNQCSDFGSLLLLFFIFSLCVTHQLQGVPLPSPFFFAFVYL